MIAVTRVRARETSAQGAASPPRRSFPDDKPVIRLTQAFDAARTEVWGPKRSRLWPSQFDEVTTDH